jgi:hypothetical protein
MSKRLSQHSWASVAFAYGRRDFLRLEQHIARHAFHREAAIDGKFALLRKAK